jgi:uncharacterized membrane protein YdcZ (DUF606 family)
MKTAPLLWALALVTAALIPVQAAANAALSRSILGDVAAAALTLFRAAPWWSFTGGLDAGVVRMEEYRSSEPVIRLIGTMSVVTHEVTTAGVRKGERFRSRVQVTQVWIREGGRWRRAAFHDSPLEM